VRGLDRVLRRARLSLARRTLGLGCPSCGLAFKPGREMPIPEPLAGLLPGT
jgi:hypothetical protein